MPCKKKDETRPTWMCREKCMMAAKICLQFMLPLIVSSASSSSTCCPPRLHLRRSGASRRWGSSRKTNRIGIVKQTPCIVQRSCAVIWCVRRLSNSHSADACKRIQRVSGALWMPMDFRNFYICLDIWRICWMNLNGVLSPCTRECGEKQYKIVFQKLL